MNNTLRLHFDAAVELIERKKQLAQDIADWRKQTASNGLAPKMLLKLAKESLWNEDEQRKAADEFDLEKLYRKELDLPLFNWRGDE